MQHSNELVVLPKHLTKGEELVIVPRKEYEGLLRFYKAGAKKMEPGLSKGLLQALKEVREGKVSKAYNDVNEMMKDLLS